MSSYYFFLSIQPNFNPYYGSSIEQCSQPKKNDQIEFTFVLAESSSNKDECLLFHCILDAFMVTQKFFLWVVAVATGNYAPFCIADIKNQFLIDRASCLEKTKTLNAIPTRSLCYLILTSMINSTTHFKTTALSYFKIIWLLFQVWKTKLK